MNIFEYFKKNGIDTVDPSFYTYIRMWDSWYRSNVAKFHTYRVYTGSGYTRCRRHSLGGAKLVCEDMANLLLNERVKFTFGTPSEATGKIEDTVANSTYDFVKLVLNNARWWKLGNEYQERKAALGTVAYVPYLDNAVVDEDGNILSGDVKIAYFTAPNIYPITWENGYVSEAAFVSIKTFRRKKYAHIQFHMLENGQYVIKNSVVECTNGAGSEIPPERWGDIPAFATLAPRVETGSDKPQFVIDTLNIVNNIDKSETDDGNPMGISLFANAIDVLRSLDLKYDSYAQEFSLGRKRIFVAPEMLSNKDGNAVFDENDTVFYILPEDFREDGGEKGMIHEVNMELRIEEHSKGINDDLNYLSKKCGFGTQRYRFDTSGITTATQVISENSDMYRTLVKHELVLDDTLKQLFKVIIRLGIAARVPNLSEDVEIRIDFDDSIIEDKKAERDQDRQDVSMGVMGLAEYRAKWYGETEETAAGRIPEQTGGVMP
ncbi:MAG: phage portal protein [Prevotella sp.]|nr:phage portal protein [Prevotella sp.]